MDILCTADMCPVILNATCVFYEGNNLIYTGITTNDSLQTALQKIDAKFGDANVGYIFTNGVYQPTAGSAVGLGGALTSDTSIGGNYTLTFTGNVKAAKHITTGGTASQFVKGDGTLDSTAYQAAGNYITALTGDVIAAGPGSAAASLAVVNINPGTYGSGTRIPVVTVDTKGRVTALTTTAIVVPSGSLSFVGDVYGSGTTGSQTTLTLTNVNSNVYTNNTFLKFKVNAKGLVTGAAPITHVDIEGVLGYVPVPETRTITINGTTHDLQANVVFSLPGGGTVQSVSVTAGTGISASVANPTINPNITITNTAPDQVVTITGQSGIDVTGTYPNFTISANEEGAVTSVTASAPLASSGGQTPNITITKADLTTDGYLSSADWSTFNAKQYALNGTGLVRMDGTTVSYDNTAYTPQSRTLTINGVSYDLAADRSWTINSMVYPEAGIAVSTGTGWGTSLVDNSANWNTAYSERISSASSPLSIASNAISISQAGASTNGYLSSTDWNTFNNKQASGNYITDLTGEATASGPGSATVTLSTPAVTSKLLTGVNITGGSIVATDSILTAFGKVQNQINGLIGGTIYKGVWNASTNTPALASGVGTLGWYYIVNVPGTTNLDGITDWHLGDWAIFDGLAWQQVDNTDAVVSVNGYTGAVSLVSSDIPEGLTNLYWTSTRFNTAFSGKTTTDLTEGTQLYYTDGRARSAISLTTTGTSGAATYDNSTGVLNIPQYQGGVTSFNTRTGAITLLDTDVTTALGYTPVTNARTLTINGTTYDLTANRSWTVSGTMPAGGTAGQILSKIDATDYNTQWIDNFASQVKNIVKLGAALAKGTPVYVSGADGTNMIVSASSNTTEAGSSKTFGLLEAGGVLNDQVECVTYGLIDGLDTSAANAAGDPVWLGPNGTLLYGLANKPVAPAHMVYIGVVTRKQSNNGEIFVNIQNGFEVDELHDVLISAPKTDGQGLFLQTIAGVQLWRNRTIADVLGYTPANAANYVPYSGATQSVNLGAHDLTVQNITVGLGAGAQLSNLAIGNNALGSTTGTSNVAVGGNALSGSVSFNTAVGANALANNVFGSRDVAIGYKAGFTNQVGSDNVYIGAEADAIDYNGYSNSIAIGSNVKISASNTTIIGNSSTVLSTIYGALKQTFVTSALLKADSVGKLVAAVAGTDYVAPSALSGYLLLTGGTLTGGLVINPANTGTVGLDAASDTIRLRADSTNPFPRQLTTTMGSGTLVKMQAAGYGATYVTDLGFYTSSSSAVNTVPNLYLTGGNNYVGINTDVPAYALDVVGDVNITGTFRVNGTPLSGGGVTSFNTRTGAITLTSTDVTTALGYTPVTDARTLTINGTTYDLTANRSWTIAPSSAARVEETFTATAGQTVFTVTGGYIVGLVDVYVNGVKYAPADYTATNGTTVVLNTGVVVGDIVDIINYTATIAALPTSRDVFDYTATAAQTTFTVSGGYVVGLLDVYVNGVKLTSSEVTATNGTTFVLTVASVAGDQVQAIRYNTSVNGVSGSGTANYIPKFTASGTIGNSAITDNGTTVSLVSRALSGTSATFTSTLTANDATINGGILLISSLAGGADLLMNRTNTSNGSSITLLTDAVEKWNIGLRSAGTTDNFFIYNSNLLANSLTISNTNNAATFSSSVTATSFVSDGAASEGSIRIERDTVSTNTVIGSLNFTNNNGATTYGKVFGGRNSAGDGYIALGTGVSNNLYALENGNIGIGTASPIAYQNYRYLQIDGASTTQGGVVRLRTSDGSYVNEFAVDSGGGYISSSAAFQIYVNNSPRLYINTSGNVGIGTTSTLQKFTLAGTQMMYNTAGDGVVNTVIGSITSQVRNYGTNIATNSFASIQFATDPSTWYKGDIRFLTNGSDGTGSGPTERMRITSGGNIDTKGNPIYAFSGAFSMGASYQTIFTSVSDAVYLISVNTNPSSGDGTFGLLIAFNEGDKSCGTIYGNNILIQFSGNDVQIRSTNGSTYSVSWSATRIK